jgi:hypothetical protein
MADSISIQSIHPDTRQMVVNLNIEGTAYVKVIPFFSTQDADLLTAQLQAFSQELRAEFDALKAAVQAADAGNVLPPSDAVAALVGTEIPVDTTPPPVS